MGFFGNVVSAVVGAVAKVAKAVVNFFSPLAEKGGTVASNVTNVAEAVLGVTAEVAEVTEDGEIDDEDIEEIIEEKFKLLVGAWIANFGSESSSDKKTDNANSSKGAVKKSFNSFKEIGNDIITSIKERTDKKCDSVYDFNNWMFFGIPGAVKSIWDSNGERGEKAFKSGSVYDYANWLSMGGGDMVKGAFNPEEQFSKEHWEDSFGVVSTIFGIKGYKGSKKGGILESKEIDYGGKDVDGGSKANPSEIAQSWQGDFPYVGVDKYRNITLKKGKVIYVGDPYPTGYATTKSAVDRRNGDSRKLFEGLQVKPYWEDGMDAAEYRSKMMAYEITEDTDVAFGITKANPQFGDGGLPQMFIPDFNELVKSGKIKRIESKAIDLNNYKMSLEDYNKMLDVLEGLKYREEGE